MSVYIPAMLACLLLSSFFSSSEMSFSSANRLRLENAMEKGSAAARIGVQILDRYDDALSAILIGNNLVNIAMSSLASVFTILVAGEEWTWLATLIVTVLVIIFGETMPKIVAKKNANRLVLVLAWPVRGLMFLLFPVIRLVVGFVHLVTLPFRGEPEDGSPDAAVEELQSIIETAEDEKVLDEDRSELLQAALDFAEVSAFEVMTARVDVVAIDIDDDWENILELIQETPYSRIPVYEDSIDNVIGVLYLNHLLKTMVDEERPDLRALLMEPLYVYKTIKLPHVLSQLRHAKKHLAVVTDEYGGMLGVISMEDVLEELVGEIWDETDVVEREVVERADGEYELDGDMLFDDFLELLGLPYDGVEFESDTLGGWTIEYLGAFPREGQSFEYGGLRITVLRTDGLRVEKALVRRLEAQEES